MPKRVVLIAAGFLIAAATAAFLFLLPKKTYTAADFGIQTVISPVDYDGDGIDDYADFLRGAKADAEKRPRYDGAYVVGGYPADDVGVCTDLVWRAFREAGYSLKDMIDADIAAHPEAYSRADPPDPHIDFRRVPNLHVFFDRHAVPLTTDLKKIEAFQPGDIVIFGGDKHIGMLSDKRNRRGVPYLLHHTGQLHHEEDVLSRYTLIAHYRFDASRVDENVLKPFTENRAFNSNETEEKP